MSDDPNKPDGTETRPLSAQIDEICDRFEADWNAGRQPQIKDYLGGVPEGARGSLFRELLVVELELRHRDRQQPTADEYHRRFPDDHEQIDAAFAILTAPHVGETLRRAGDSSVDQPQGLHVRCPHCRNPIEILDDTPMEEIVCGSCGSSFNLVGDEALTYQTISGTPHRRRKFGHFELIEQLGFGASAAVWKARDTQLDRTVAVKIPRKGHLSRGETEQFLREVRAAAQLRHPNIVSVYEVGVEGELIYLVHDFVEGLSLHDWLTGQRLTYREATELCAKVADAIHFAHEQGVIHRDLKPSNILLDRAGEPHVMDFGLARREADEITMTMDGQVLGTPAYRSPEQAKGEGHRADRRTDIYSLGVILFQLLTGDCPFRGNVRMLLKQVIEDEPPSPRKFDSHVPRDLETICLKCLEKQPRGRYGSAGEVAGELRRFLTGEPIQARPISRLARGWRWCKRNPAVAALSATAVLLLAAVAVVGTVGYVRESAQRKRAQGAEQKALIALGKSEIAEKEAENARRDAEITLADMYTSYGLVAAERGNPQEAVLWFANAAEKARNDPERELSNRVRFRSWSREFPLPVRSFQHKNRWISQIAFDPSGQYLMVHDQQPNCTICYLEKELPFASPDVSRPITAGAWNPAGDRLALATCKGQVEIHSFPAGEILDAIPHKGMIQALVFSPGGRYLAIASEAVRVWDCRERDFATPELPHPAPVVRLSFTSDNSRLATACVDGLARVYAVSTLGANSGPLLRVVHNGRLNEQFARPIFVDNDRAFLTVCDGGRVGWWDSSTGKLIRRVQSGLGSLDGIVASPDARFLAIHGYASARLLNTGDAYLIADLQHTNGVPEVVFSPDGNAVLTVSGDRTARLWAIPSGRPLTAPIEHNDELKHCAFSCCGRLFATSQRDGLIRVWALPNPPKNHHITVGVSDQKAAMSALGQYIVPAGWGLSRRMSATRVHEVITGKPAGPWLDVGGLINEAAFSPQGDGLVTVSSLPEHSSQQDWRVIQWDRQPGQVIFWDWRTGKRLFDPLETVSEPIGVAYSPGGKVVVVVCAAGEILLLQPSTGRVVKRLQHGGTARPAVNPERWVCFAPSGEYFVTLGLGYDVRAWATATGAHRYTLKHGAVVRNVSFSQDGHWVATASDDKRARVYDAATGKLAARPLEHPDWVFSVRFSSDGRHLLTACRDHMARLWNWQTGELICPALEHKDEVFHAVFSPDGRWILTAGRDGSLRTWEWRTGRPVAPTRELSGARGCVVLLTPDASHAVVAGEMPGLDIFDLSDLSDRGAPGIELPSLRTLGEILSGRMIQGGGSVNLTSAEWLQRWQPSARSILNGINWVGRESE